MLGTRKIRINGAECGAESLLLTAITSIGGLMFGYDIGQISGILLVPDFIDRFAQLQPDGTRQWEPIIQSLIVSLMSIGALMGAFTGGYTAGKLGRRLSISIGVTIYTLGGVVQVTAMHAWWHYTLGRLVSGLGIGILSVVVPMYQGECAPKEIRGAVIATYQLAITLGIVVANAINLGMRCAFPPSVQRPDAAWRVVVCLGTCFCVTLAVGVLFLPESPRWLAGQGDWAGVRSAVARLRGFKDDTTNRAVEEELQEMAAVLEQEARLGEGGWLECFTGAAPGNGSSSSSISIHKLRYRTVLGVAIHFLQQWTGANYFFYYGSTIFSAAGLHDPILTQLILGAVNLVSTFLGLYLVEKVGRRMPLFIGALWQVVWLLVFASVGTAKDPSAHPDSGKIMIVAACMFIASFASSWGPMAWVVVGETFPMRTRAKQASLATAANWGGNFLLAFLTPLANAGISFRFGFVFASTNLAAAALVYLFLYESAGLSLESVDLMYSDPAAKAWTSAAWAPPGWHSREKRTREPLLLPPAEEEAEGKAVMPPGGGGKRQSTVSGTTVAAAEQEAEVEDGLDFNITETIVGSSLVGGLLCKSGGGGGGGGGDWV
ncbi:unnamed protein product [Discula destructiva]